MSDVLLLNADGAPVTHVPLSLVSWQVALRLVFLDKVKVLKEYDNWLVRSQHLEVNIPSIIMMTEHVKWRKELKYNKSNVFLRDNFTCQLQSTSRCKEMAGRAKITDLTLDHVVPRARGGKTSWLNVCTACKNCNSEKGSDHTIVPKNKPYLPTYYEISAKRKTLPIYVYDADWQFYIDWPAHLVKVIPHPRNKQQA